MRRILFVMAAVALVCSCSKGDLEMETGDLQESVLYVSLTEEAGTKATGAGHGMPADDGNIQTLEIFVFRVNAGMPDDGVLDGYRKFTASELGSLTNLEVQTTTGNKMIYAVANSHRANWKGVNTRALFEQQTALLAEDDLKNFIMIGGTQEQLQLATTVSFSIKRLVTRVQVSSIRTAFASGPYEGLSLTEVKAYLLNAQASKYLYNGTGDNLKVYNQGAYKADDAGACTMPGMIYDNLGADIQDAGYSTQHYIYCYANGFTEETAENRFTRLVIEGKLNGITYYYPIVLEELERNCCYSLDVTIKRPGSTDPDSEVEKGTILATLTVQDWKVLPETSVEF